MLRVETIDNSIEDLIITGMIIDTPFLQKISRAALPEYFETDVSKILVRWIREYFFTNKNTAPQEELMDIFQLNEQDLDADESKTVRTFLKKINKEYEGREFNSEYVIPKALRYLEGNAYRYKIKLIERELKKGGVEKAKDIFNGTSKEIFDQVTTWKSLSDNELLNSWWGEIKYPAMRFSGALGQYMPNIERGRFYAMFGPAKRGKSFWLLEWAYQGAFDGLNTVVFSLEMNATELDQRWKEKITGKSIMNKKVDTFNIPVLDCIHNQKNKCQIPECKSPGTCVFTGNLRDSWVDHPEHKPCTHCKGLDDNLFVPSYWMIQEKIPRLSLKEAKDTQRQLDEHIGENRVRIISFPITSATVADLEKALEELALHEKFIADLIVIDYADILKEDVKLGEKRHRVGDNWQQLSRMAKTRNAIVVTASQGNRGSAKKNRLDVDDVAEDFSKIMTIDGIFAINEVNFDQADKWQIDHNWQVQRIETIALRYGKFIPGLQCVTFNDLARGQIYMDGFINWR